MEEDDFYTSIRTATPVRLIMTPASDLLTCKTTDDAEEVDARPELADFDHIPVKQDGQIAGIFDRNRKGLTGRVADNFRPLDAAYLIGDRAPVFTFIERVPYQRCCIVVGERGIVGMVTASDLQKLPVQVALFGLLAQFEALVTELLRRSLGDPEAKYESVLDLLSNGQVKNARRHKTRNDAKNLSIDWISPLSLGDKLHALEAKQPELMDWHQAGQVKDLRDSVAHGKEFAQTYELIDELVIAKMALFRLVHDLRQHLKRRTPARHSAHVR
jgi:CBS domain-containing protein